jgi:hypothetical protein
MLRIFSPEKIQWLQPGVNPRSWVPEASMLTNRHRSHLMMQHNCHYCVRTEVPTVVLLKIQVLQRDALVRITHPVTQHNAPQDWNLQMSPLLYFSLSVFYDCILSQCEGYPTPATIYTRSPSVLRLPWLVCCSMWNFSRDTRGTSSNHTVFTVCLLINLFVSAVQRLNLFS